MSLVVVVDGGSATHVVYCAESQITGSPPLLSDLDILFEMEDEGRSLLPESSTAFFPSIQLSHGHG